jgi:hypothetical protein
LHPLRELPADHDVACAEGSDWTEVTRGSWLWLPPLITVGFLRADADMRLAATIESRTRLS